MLGLFYYRQQRAGEIGVFCSNFYTLNNNEGILPMHED
jgi:hypothetical protein